MVTYRGDDRRADSRRIGEPSFGRGHAVVVVLLAGLTAWLVARGRPDEIPTQTDALLATSAAALLVAAVALSAFRYRVGGHVAALWASISLLLAAAGVVLYDALPSVVDVPHRATTLAVLALTGSIAACARAAFGPAVDTGVRPGRAAGLTLGATGVAMLLAWEIDLDLSATGSSDAVALTLAGALAIAWAATAGVLVRRAGVRRSWTFVWHGVLASALALHEAARAWSIAYDEPTVEWHVAPVVIGAGLVLFGTLHDMHSAFVVQRAQLLSWEVLADSARERSMSARESAEVRAHKARNLLCGVAGAAQILDRYHDRLPADTRASLVQSLTAEVAELQELISLDVDGEGAPESDQGSAPARPIGMPSIDAI